MFRIIRIDPGTPDPSGVKITFALKSLEWQAGNPGGCFERKYSD